jgi:small-conductance mechanosensitive channel
MDFQEMLTYPGIYGPLASIATVLALLLLKRWLFNLIARLAERTSTRMDDLLLEAASRPTTLLIFASGLFMLGQLLDLPPKADRAIFILYTACVVGALVWFVDRLSRGLLDTFAQQVVVIRQTRGIIQGTVRVLLVGVGLLILLDSAGISITPLIASLGVGSLAVALALQPTLTSLFAGFQVVADKTVERGQFVKLESGEEGFVESIGWRSTRIRLTTNAMLILPNSRLVDSRITNYDLPQAETAVLVAAGVGYGSDLARVEQVTLDVARQVMQEVEGGVPGFTPLVRFDAFADSSITFDVVMRVRTYPDHNLIIHEFIKRLHARYRAEGIVIPYPVRTLDLPEEVLGRLGAAS